MLADNDMTAYVLLDSSHVFGSCRIRVTLNKNYKKKQRYSIPPCDDVSISCSYLCQTLLDVSNFRKVASRRETLVTCTSGMQSHAKVIARDNCITEYTSSGRKIHIPTVYPSFWVTYFVSFSVLSIKPNHNSQLFGYVSRRSVRRIKK